MSAEMIITARIATLAESDGFGWSEAIAIDGGRVVAAGSTADVAELAGPATERWDLGVRHVVVPGITDAHLHLMTAAQEALEVDLHDAPDLDATFGRIAAAHEQMTRAGDAGWLLGHGWSLDQIGRWPTVEDLERLAPGRPAALWAHDHHSLWASEPALRAAGITRDTPEPEGGLIRRDASGDATGVLHEHATKLVSPAIPRPSDERLEEALRTYAATLAAFGVVAAQDPGELFDEPTLRWGPTFYRRLAREGRLPLRVTASIRPEQIAKATEVGFRSADAEPAATRGDAAAARIAARYRGGWLKLFADGSLGSRSAALLEPYETEAEGRMPTGGPAGMLLDTPEQLRDYAERAMGVGVAVQIHGIGDAAVRTAIDILAALPRHPEAVMHRVEHAQLVDPHDWPRFGAHGIVASIQPCQITSDAEMARRAWGARTVGAFPVRSILDGGALVAFGTDAPVESPSPWPNLSLAVGRAFHPEQSIDLVRALRAACLDPALSAGETDRGRLVAGHRADLVVLDAAVLDEPVRPDGALHDARPLATLIDGEVVYRDSAFDP